MVVVQAVVAEVLDAASRGDGKAASEATAHLMRRPVPAREVTRIVEAAIGGGLPRTVLVGLPDTALYEARDRCRAAVAGAGLAWPNQLLTINLTPASLPKAGSHYDLAIVAAILAASDVVAWR